MNNENIHFKDLLKKMATAQEDSTKERPVIVGGCFAHAELTRFLDIWRPKWKAMPYHIWEQINEIGFHAEPKTVNYLLRGEVFGAGGHLSLRRDGNRWLWHFIGPTGTEVGSAWGAELFWTQERMRTIQLRRYAESSLLWGEAIVDKQENKLGIWWEDRVGAAKLKYPEELKEHKRVYLHYWRYTEGGQTAFVWYRELNGKAADND